MKLCHLGLIFLIVFLVTDIAAEKVVKRKKTRRKPIHIESFDYKNDIQSEEAIPIAPPGDEDIDNRVPLVDPCMQVRCGAGRICQVNELREPECVCIPTCPEESESRRKVCSNYNETWSSDCAIYQQRCLCAKGDQECKGPQYKHVHIEYYGQCREMPHCTQEEMADFPRRMRDWLFNIMRDLADRQELTPHYMNMEKEAESNMTRRWTNAAVWKFCDLDGNPPDRSVSRHELFPIRAPLMALEHCISPFLNSCDADNNHRITLHEWAKCLQLEEEEIEHQCEEISDISAE
uniref:SPARC n=1 Tax=Diabrotica virgifera virgifera TaxID=50390 RepID=A0A6P7FHJ6_DIAVI